MGKQPRCAGLQQWHDMKLDWKTAEGQRAPAQRPEVWAKACYWFSPILAHIIYPLFLLYIIVNVLFLLEGTFFFF